MLTSRNFENILVVQSPVDFRKQHDGLIREAIDLGVDTTQNSLVIFVGRRRNRTIKIVYSDRSGIWVATKKFSSDVYKDYYLRLTSAPTVLLSQRELERLIE